MPPQEGVRVGQEPKSGGSQTKEQENTCQTEQCHPRRGGEGGAGANQVVLRLKNKRTHVKLSYATTGGGVRAGQEPIRWFSDYRTREHMSN